MSYFTFFHFAISPFVDYRYMHLTTLHAILVLFNLLFIYLFKIFKHMIQYNCYTIIQQRFTKHNNIQYFINLNRLRYRQIERFKARLRDSKLDREIQRQIETYKDTPSFSRDSPNTIIFSTNNLNRLKGIFTDREIQSQIEIYKDDIQYFIYRPKQIYSYIDR